MKQIIIDTLRLLNRKEKKTLTFLLISNALISVIDVVSLAILVYVINFYTQTFTISLIYNLPDWLADRNSMLPILFFLIFFSIKNLSGLVLSKLQFGFVFDVSTRISTDNLEKYLNGSFKDFVETDSSIYIRRLSHQPVEFAHHVLAGLQQIATELTLVLLSITAIIIFNAKLFLLLLIVLAPPLLLMTQIIKKRLRFVRKNIKEGNDLVLQYLKESLAGFVESNLYGKNAYFIDKHEKQQKKLNGYLSELQFTHTIPSRLIEVFAIFGLFLLILVNKKCGIQSGAVLSMGAFIAAAYKIIPGVVKIVNLSTLAKTYSYTISDLSPNIENDIPDKSKKYNGSINIITFQDIYFSRGTKNVLNRVNLLMESGDFVGLSGSSGMGKTTLINILLGFLEEQSGNILINNTSIKADMRQCYWHRISYVKQQTYLIQDSILNNIVLDNLTIDEKRLTKAIESSGLNTIIKSFPEGLDKTVSENGKNLSGGQRQRIAIARAIYKESDLIILDEPTSELDEESEVQIFEFFQKLAMEGKIIVLITHNQKNLSFCNKVLSLGDITQKQA